MIYLLVVLKASYLAQFRIIISKNTQMSQVIFIMKTLISQNLLKVLLVFAFAFSWFAVSTHSVHAMPINEESAQQIKNYLDTQIKKYSDIQKLAGNKYEWEGDVTVEPVNSYFAITLPYLKISQFDGSKMDIGMIAINTTPSEREGMWKVAIATPTPIKYFNAAANKNYTFNIMKQRMNGLWINDANQFLKLSGLYEDINVTDDANRKLLDIQSVSLKQDFDITGDNRWSGDYNFKLNGFSLADDETAPATIKFDEFSMVGNIVDFNTQSVQSLQDSMHEASESIEDEDAANIAALQNIDFNKMFDGFFDYFANFGKSTEALISLKGLDVSQNGNQLFAMGNFGMSMDMLDMDTNQSTVGFGMKFDNIDMNLNAISPAQGAGYAALVKPYIPHSLSFKTSLVDIPYITMIEDLKAEFDSAMNEDTMQTTSSDFNFNEMMTKYDMRLVLSDTGLTSDLYSVRMNADIKPAPQSMFKVKGMASTQIFGLQQLVQQMQKDAQNTENPAFAAQVQQGLGVLTMLQMMGQQETIDGQVAHVYNLDIQESGQMFLNGTDMMQMQSMMMGGGAPQ